MLKQRIVTALVLLAFLLPALLIKPTWPFALLTGIAFAAAGWEWARLNDAGAGRDRPRRRPRRRLPARLPRRLDDGRAAPRLVDGDGALGARRHLGRCASAWPAGRGYRVRCASASACVALWLCWLAMVNALVGGLNYILSIFMLVWTADVFAYFGGRAFGRRKLAPAISPGKSWAGVWSGMVGTLLVAVAWLAFDGRGLAYYDSFYTLVNERVTTIGLALVVVFLVAMSVVGDLFESLVKRSAGAKDSSGLLPGHGGILDRIDALLPVFPIALALAPPS